ncbi:MAG: DeoR/GlpR transcriptional regulator [Thermotogae bacterium]|nr:DeoR/GlpR transcriptional regulator [Thermotogota bacterium]
MFTEERRSKIVELLRASGKVTVAQLSKLFEVSEVTIRKDLDALEQEGKLLRTHGGAILPTHSRSEWNFLRKIHQREEEKKAIASVAVNMIEDGDTVILDSSSTNYYLALEMLKRSWKHLTIVTNNVFIASKLIETNAEIIVLGGTIRENSLSIIGPWTLKFLQEISVDIAFMGTTGFSKERGFMTPSVVEADTKRAMVKSASRVVVVSDSTKFNRKAFASFAFPEDVHYLITDEGIPTNVEKFLREKGVTVEKVSPGRR